MLNPAIRADFPILKTTMNDQALVYLDSAATSQKPQLVIDRLVTYYQEENANVHRGVYRLADQATQTYEGARKKIAGFFGLKDPSEWIFTRGTTTSLNWLASALGQTYLQAGDQIWLSIAEHHANLIPWQEIARAKGLELCFVPLLEDGQIDYSALEEALTPKAKVLALAHASNVLGTLHDIKRLSAMIHAVGGLMVVDGAQAAPHIAVDLKDLDCDFYAVSAHKMLGPTGIGGLYGKKEILESLQPQEFGGEMIHLVTKDRATWADLPWRFEAGTPAIGQAIAWGAAIDYLQKIGMEAIHAHEQELTAYLMPQLLAIPGLTLLGPQNPKDHTGVFAFTMEGIHPHDLASALDQEGIAIRAGHHCAQPLMQDLGIFASARASFYLYNTKEEADLLIHNLYQAKEYFSHGIF